MLRLSPILAFPLALAACSDAEPDPRGVDRDEVLLQVSATGRADTTPNEARFTAGVDTVAATAGEAHAKNTETINKVVAALEKFGVKPADVQTRHFSLGRIDYGPQRGRFRANNLIEVKMRDVARAGEAIATTTEAGANVLSGPSLALSDPEAASRSAYAQAYKAARARAEAYAGAAGLKVARVLAIRDSGALATPPYYDAMMGRDTALEAMAPPPVAMAAQEAPSIRPGTSTREVAVRVDFALAE